MPIRDNTIISIVQVEKRITCTHLQKVTWEISKVPRLGGMGAFGGLVHFLTKGNLQTNLGGVHNDSLCIILSLHPDVFCPPLGLLYCMFEECFLP